MKLSVFKEVMACIPSTIETTPALLLSYKPGIGAFNTIQWVAAQVWHQQIVPLYCPIITDPADIVAALASTGKEVDAAIVIEDFDRATPEVREFIMKELLHKRENVVHLNKNSRIIITTKDPEDTFDVNEFDYVLLDKMWKTTLEADND